VVFTKLGGTDDASQPFWSADSRFIAFVARGRLKQLGAEGGAPKDIAPAQGFSGGAWNREGTILFGSDKGIYRVSSEGGDPAAVTTLDAQLARQMEPRAAAPYRRLRTIEALARAGVPVGVSVAPQIPFINTDMEQVLEAAWDAGARRAFYTVLRLPWELAPLFRQWLELHYPDRAERVLARVREMRGGQTYEADFASRMKGHGVWADLVHQRFEKTCARLGYGAQRVELDMSQFRRAGAVGQGRLF